MIRFGRAICGDLAQAERREWWLSNGLGGYAAGTVAGSLTRRYHGLLITPLNNALDRQLLFTRAEPALEIDGQHYPLSCNHWQSGTIAPRGHVHIESFRLDGQLPVWVYAVGDVRLEQRIFMEQGEATVWVAFRLMDAPADTPINLQLRLWVNQRDHHSQMSSGGITPDTQILDKRSLQVSYADTSRLHIQLDSGELQVEHNWINDLQLPHERERGLPDRDNHLAIAEARLTLNDNHWHGLRAGLHPCHSPDPAAALQHEQRLQSDYLARAHARIKSVTPDWIEPLIATTERFLFRRPLKEGGFGESIIAGYPWFGDWGRDTMIALPGLTLSTGQLPLARRILETWADYVDQGMIPNRFPESAASTTPEYNSVDASLWYILAWHAYMEAGGEETALRNVLPVLEQIISAYHHGTRYQIHLDENSGLLHTGEPGTQLTWMDARVNGIAMTPRIGKPVEVNALWYNALCAMQVFCEQLGRNGNNYAALAEHARLGFQQYLRPDGGLYDVLDTPEGNDASIRPNQIFALSLPWPLLDKDAANTVLSEVHKHLYTSYGLRSLTPQDPAYRGIYQGGVVERDAAYHNGPVWGWLLGHHAMAHFRLHHDAPAALALLEPMGDHLFDAGLGSISEIFDGDPPHQPRGAPSQAWSVATVLEAWRLIQDQAIQKQVGSHAT
ncbi:MAG: amylo-alpha-1,6-glucosidase [Gammaproteobacteria bacterium]|nr:MAG: amylo-alpha-1,6-glucosidase [Gammaproteobacteria bacterium]